MTLTPFSNDEFELAVITDGDTFRVLAPQLAKALGFREAFDLLRSIPEAEKGSELVRTLGGEQRVGCVCLQLGTQLNSRTGEQFQTVTIRITPKGVAALAKAYGVDGGVVAEALGGEAAA